jgi:hypothetical protein
MNIPDPRIARNFCSIYNDSLLEVFSPLNQNRVRKSAVKNEYNSTARKRNSLCCMQVPFNTGTLNFDPRDCKNFPLKIGFRYFLLPFKQM